MEQKNLLGHDVQVFWSVVPQGKKASMIAIFHGSDNGQYVLEFDGKMLLVPFGSVRYLMEHKKKDENVS